MATLDLALLVSAALIASVVGGFFFRFVGSIAAKRAPGGFVDKASAFMLALCNDVAGAAAAAQAGKSVMSPQIMGDDEMAREKARGGYTVYRAAVDGIGRDGNPLPLWEELPYERQMAYIALAKKVRS